MNLSKRCHSYWYIKDMFGNKMMQVFILFVLFISMVLKQLRNLPLTNVGAARRYTVHEKRLVLNSFQVFHCSLKIGLE